MINFYAKTRKRKEYLYEGIEQELKNNDIPLSLFDDKLQWNIYSDYGEGFVKTGSNPNDGYSYIDSFDLDFVVVECVKKPSFFRENKKYWLIFRLGETSGVHYPELQFYKDRKIWDSEASTIDEIKDIVIALCQDANNYYYEQAQEYRRERFQEQEWEDFGPNDTRSDENRDFDSLMNENDAWSNID